MITYKTIEYQTLPTLVRKIRELVKRDWHINFNLTWCFQKLFWELARKLQFWFKQYGSTHTLQHSFR